MIEMLFYLVIALLGIVALYTLVQALALLPEIFRARKARRSKPKQPRGYRTGYSSTPSTNHDNGFLNGLTFGLFAGSSDSSSSSHSHSSHDSGGSSDGGGGGGDF